MMTLRFLRISGFLILFGMVLIGGVLVIGAQTPAHLLAFKLHQWGEDHPYIYVSHVERGLEMWATRLPSNDFFLRISPDGEWLLYIAIIEPINRFGLVNLETWESRLLPEMSGDAMHFGAQWDGERIQMAEYRTNGTTAFYIYDIATDDVREVDALPPLPYRELNHVIIGSSVAGTADAPTLAITLDRDNIPRLYDYETSEGRLTSFEIGRDIPPVSVSPDMVFLATPIYRDRQTDIYLIPAWEGEMMRLTDDDLHERNVAWSPDGRYLSYTVEITSVLPRRLATEIRVYDVARRELAYTIAYDRDRITETVPAWIP